MKYIIKERLGSGTFGNVFLVEEREKKVKYALKRIRTTKEAIYGNKSREVYINKLLEYKGGSNYIPLLKDNFYSYEYDSKRSEKIYYNNLVLEKFGISLSHYIRELINDQEIRDYLRQLFIGLSFIHSLNIVHRDLKPSNLLIDINRKILKICDFGSSKIMKENEKSTPLVTSRFYRSPELLLGSCNYSSKIDIWSCGCIMAEMYLHQPLFIAFNTDGEQLLSIADLIGSPSKEDLIEMKVLPDSYEIYSNKSISRINFHSIFFDLVPEDGIELLEQILQYNPNKRPSCEEILKHRYFNTN